MRFATRTKIRSRIAGGASAAIRSRDGGGWVKVTTAKLRLGSVYHPLPRLAVGERQDEAIAGRVLVPGAAKSRVCLQQGRQPSDRKLDLDDSFGVPVLMADRARERDHGRPRRRWRGRRHRRGKRSGKGDRLLRRLLGAAAQQRGKDIA